MEIHQNYKYRKSKASRIQILFFSVITQALIVDERKSLFKMADKTIATVQKIETYITTDPDFAPFYMDKTDFLKEEMAFRGLNLSQFRRTVNL